ncbi:unnamed protein product [Rotaria magnacalcarata]|uniref:non-specific serine/threonine protein kinase n=3 Tax=Rotaria magnacalcarata TaxID=392030 RepID=A0A816T3P0_9BILA|nr:unnamed protein product [Rotaria magnacalcarata]
MPQVVYPSLVCYYELLKTVGHGGFGKVKQAIHLLTGEFVAIKIIDKAKLGSDAVRVALEIKAMKDLRHQYICQLYQVIETTECYFLVLEYFCNGELFDYIVNRNRLSEEQARHFFRQIVSAENLLLDRRENLKLIDFGLCAQPKGGINLAYLGTACGSPAKLLLEPIIEADMWSLDVLLYTLLCGTLPFDDENIGSMYSKIQNDIYYMPPFLSPESVALLRLMLQVNPMKRIRLDDLLCHPWLINQVYTEPVEWESLYQNNLDLSCIREMALYYGRTVNDITQEIYHKRYDYLTATYFILLNLKSRNKPIRLPPNCQRILLFAESPSGPRRVSVKKVHRITASKSFDDGLDGDNLDDSKIASALKAFSVGAVDSDDLDVYLTPKRQTKKVRSLFCSVERGLNTVKQILTPKRLHTNRPRKTWETANVTSLNCDDFDQLCDLLEQSINLILNLNIKKTGISRFIYDVFIEDDWGKIVLEFNLEIVAVQGKEFGLQRKRTKGSAWHYKRCFEDIIRQLNRHLPQLQTSV